MSGRQDIWSSVPYFQTNRRFRNTVRAEQALSFMLQARDVELDILEHMFLALL